MFSIGKYILKDLVKNKVILGYVIFLAACGWGTFMLESQHEKVILILMQITLLVVPLITIIFSSTYYYNSLDFINLLLTQPLKRKVVLRSIYAALCFALCLAFGVGIFIPALVFYPSSSSLFLGVAGLLLTSVFIAIALWVSTVVDDKSRGMGLSLLLWAFFAMLYDGLLLVLMYQFSEYPIEETVLALSFLNPIDLARISIIIQTEASALLGLSGAVFKEFFGSSNGIIMVSVALLFWAVVPMIFALRKFKIKDF